MGEPDETRGENRKGECAQDPGQVGSDPETSAGPAEENITGKSMNNDKARWWRLPKWSRLSVWKKGLAAASVFVLLATADWFIGTMWTFIFPDIQETTAVWINTPIDVKYEEGLLKADIELRSGRSAEAMAILKGLDTIADDTASRAIVPYFIGRAYERLGNETAALQAFGEAYKRDSTFCPVRIKLGMNYLDRGLSHKAVPHLKYASAVDSLDAELHFDLARAYIGIKSADEAVEELVKTLKIREDYPGGKELLLSVLLSNGV